MKKIIVFVFITLVSGCAIKPRQFVFPENNVLKQEQVTTNKKVAINILTNVELRDYETTFEQEFGSNQSVVEYLYQEIQKHINEQKLLLSIVKDEVNEPSELSVVVKKITIDETYDYKMDNLHSPNNMTSQLYCSIELKVELVDSKTGKYIDSVTVFASEPASLFTFASALRSALSKSTKHLAVYLATGETKFQP